MSKSIEALSEEYFTLKLNLEEMMKMSESEAEQQALADKYTLSRRNFNEAILRVFDDNNAAVSSLTESLDKNTEAIKSALKQKKKMTSILETITAGVELGTSLVGIGKPPTT